jgi:hypothetical protein
LESVKPGRRQKEPLRLLFHARGTKGTNRLVESRLEPAHTVKTMRPMVPVEDFEISERF